MDKTILEKLYIKEKKSSVEIGKMFDVCNTTVCKRLKTYGIPIRSSLEHAANYLAKHIGKKFGRLVIIERAQIASRGTKDRMSKWKCKCDCGKILIIRLRDLKSGLTTSCGCERRKWYGGVSGEMLTQIKRNADIRKFDFNLTAKQIWNLFLKQDKKCAISGIELVLNREHGWNRKKNTASLDRIDSSKGYSLDNVQWVHKIVNRMKWDLNQKEFLNWIKIIAKHQRF
jgi:hypothetical protein